MSKSTRPPRQYSFEDLHNPTIDLSRDACLYARQSNKEQVVRHPQSHLAQTVELLQYTREVLGFKDDGSTGRVHLFVENEVIESDGTTRIKSASGTWPIERRAGLRTICQWIEHGTPEGARIGVVITDLVDRLFRDEDEIDSNIFIKLCKEYDVFVHVSSKRMTYNFWNNMHADLFRMEVKMAAAYIENYVRQTMLRRRDLANKMGRWAGSGAVPVGYIICQDKQDPLYGKFIPYEPHARVVRRLFERFVELGYDFSALEKEIRDVDVIFPPFPPGQTPPSRLMLKKALGGGYTLSEYGLRYLLTNPVYIGVFQRHTADGLVSIKNNHPAIVPEELFWSVYDHLKDQRPDGTPTNRVKRTQVRYSHRGKEDRRKPLLCPISPDGGVHWQYRSPDGKPGQNECCYAIIKPYRLGMGEEVVALIPADVLEGLIVRRLFEHLRSWDQAEWKAEQERVSEEKRRQIKELEERLIEINTKIDNLVDNMANVKTVSIVREIENKIIKYQEMRRILEEKLNKIRLIDIHIELVSIEQELQDLEDLWNFKPFEYRKALLSLLIKKLAIKYCSQHFYQVTIEWNYAPWGTEETIVYREFAGGKEWTGNEIETLKRLYPTAPSEEILQALPARSWRSIVRRAGILGLKRQVKLRLPDSKELTVLDQQFLNASGLKISDFSEEEAYKHTKIKRTKWSPPSTPASCSLRSQRYSPALASIR